MLCNFIIPLHFKHLRTLIIHLRYLYGEVSRTVFWKYKLDINHDKLDIELKTKSQQEGVPVLIINSISVIKIIKAFTKNELSKIRI
jgi:hypothetical protein